MVPLSNLLRFDVVDERRGRARLRDLGTSLLTSDYPPVTHLLFRNDAKDLVILPWDAVRAIHEAAKTIEVADMKAAQPVATGTPEKEVWLARDILDSLVIDLYHRRATRANDLWLEVEAGQLELRGADTTARAVLRRLTQGRFGLVRESGIYDWKYIEFLSGDPRGARSGSGYNMRIQRLPAGEIARLTDPLPYLHAAELLTLLPDPTAADTLEAMAPERQLQVFEELVAEQGLRLLELMAPDIAADLVGRLHPETARRYLNSLSRVRSERIIELLRYSEHVVGGIMTNDVVSIAGDMTVQEAQRLIKDRLKDPDFIHFIYIVNDDEARHLRGVISFREFFLADETLQLEAIMNSYVMSLQALAPAKEAAYEVLNSGLAALPVLSREGRLLGAVTIDAAVAQVAPASWSAQLPRIFS